MRRLLLILLLLCPALAEGGREHPVHAFLNATVYVRPGVKLENATLLIRDGKVEAVGQVAVPPEARVWDLKGKTVVAGFIDPYVTVSRLEGKPLRGTPRPKDEDPPPALKPDPDSSALPRLHPDWMASGHLSMKAETLRKLRAQGFVAVLAVPDQGVLRGTAACYSLKDGTDLERLWDPERAVVAAAEQVEWQEYKKNPYGSADKFFPASLMGACSALRQAVLDARWYGQARLVEQSAYQGTLRPAAARAHEAMLPVAEGQRLILLESFSPMETLSLRRSLDEVAVSRRATVLSGREWRCLDWLSPQAQESFVLPLNFPKRPKAESEGEWLDVSDLALQNWRNAPALARWLGARKVPFSLTTHRLKSLDDLPDALQQARRAGCADETLLAALTTEPARTLGYQDRLGSLEPGKCASFLVLDGPLFGSRTRVLETWVEGQRHTHAAPDDKDEDKEKQDKTVFQAADYTEPPRLIGQPEGSGSVLVRGATLWTVAGKEPLQADLLVVNGRIQAIGPSLSPPAGSLVVEASGLHVSPGIIDCHSHTAIEGDVNEFSGNCTSMVRIKDVIDPLDRNILLQLAGGTTCANLLHGSANSIGGQSITVKWRWGRPAEELIVQGAPEGIKFALGENPRQANVRELPARRYPGTRMGVAASIRERFVAARAYRDEQRKFASGQRALPVKPDQELDALLEILDGKRFVHCHSYRQDEILMLIRLAEELGFKVRTFQHVLEGYKVADEIAAHGAGASSFSDWWAYKVEVMEAVPYNGAILAERGVVTSFNSDSNELARRLNTEATKAVRYGGLPPMQALAFVTLNPARQLGIESRVGSLEVGKDGDFVLWSAPPLSQGAVCLETWIEGRCYFSRQRETSLQALREEARRELLQKARQK